MVRGVLLLVPVLLGTAAGCRLGSFACTDALDCEDGDNAGVCEPDGACSFPDDACESGRRYGVHGGGDRGGRCVPPVAGTDTAADASTTAADATTQVPSTTETTGMGSSEVGSSTVAATSADASESGSDGIGTSSGEDTASPESTGDAPATFFDAFDRGDADALGNGWIENNEGSFQLVAEQVVLGSDDGQDFRTNACHRPPEESLLDLEASVEIVFSSDGYAGFPQLHLRIRPESFAPDNPLDAYVIYLDSTEPEIPPYLSIVRIVDGAFGDASNVDLAPFPGNASRYRLRARATGVDPVLVEGWFEIEVDGGWQVLTETALLDTSELRIADSGMIGFSGHVALESFALDDFGYSELTR